MLFDPGFALLGMVKAPTTSATPGTIGGPPAIASPVHGMDASLTSTLFADAAGTVAATNGAGVARAYDAFGGTANSFQQGAVAERPVLVTNAVNGKPCLRFNGSTHWMSLLPAAGSGALFQGRSFTMALAFRRPATADVAGLFQAGNADGGNNQDGLDCLLVESFFGGTPMLLRATGTEYGQIYLDAAAYANNAVIRLVARCSPTNGMEFRAKGGPSASTVRASLPATADSFAWDRAVLGAELSYKGSGVPSYRFSGDIFEFRFWASRAGDAQFAALETYMERWASGAPSGGTTAPAPVTQQPSPSTPQASGTTLNVLIRGQSNAYFFCEGGNGYPYGVGLMKDRIQALTGRTVNILFAMNQPDSTIHSGSEFLTQWMNGTQAGDLENSFLRYCQNLSAAEKAAPFVEIWMHNESDQKLRPPTDQWVAAVRAEAVMARGTLGLAASQHLRYFVPIRYNYGDITSIRNGMDQLAADSTFNARVSMAAWSLRMDGDGRGPNTEHMGPQDAADLAENLAQELAALYPRS